MNELYSLQGIGRTSSGRTLLAIDRLRIGANRISVVTGPNGAGKTTLLELLAFLYPPATGQLLFRGSPVPRGERMLRMLRMEVTLMHQSPYLLSGTVGANVAVGLRLRGITGGEQRRRVDQALAMVGLTGLAGRSARELSGGEARRVALARALALGPKVLLLDEPLANVDRESAQMIEQVIRSFPPLGGTVVVTSHDPLLARRLDGTSIRMSAGRVLEPVQTAAPDADEPARLRILRG